MKALNSYSNTKVKEFIESLKKDYITKIEIIL
jgi:hypothetical protein